MHTRLQFENSSLRRQLESLLLEARHNEEKMRRFDWLERRLIGARSLAELMQLLLVEYQQAFGIEYVTLALVDPEYEAARILEAEDLGETLAGLKLLAAPETLTVLFGNNPAACLCAYDAACHGGLFNAPSGAIASVALLPLMRQGELIGSFNLGSALAARYDTQIGTDFLDRLSAIAAICLESALTQERLKRIGLTDGLTGVQNRRYFEHRSLIEISQARRHRQPLACMFLDIDKFKRINDTYGHQSGDDVLRGVAGVIQSQLRPSDTIARYGGEEFVALLPDTNGAHALEVAERIRAAVAEYGFAAANGERVPVTISIGLAMLMPEPGSAAPGLQSSMLIAAADKALYQAKHSGRNRVVSAGIRMPDVAAGAHWGWVGQALTSLTRFFEAIPALLSKGRARV